MALLLSTDCFETFYGNGLGLDPSEYVTSYRNDWSWEWCELLRDRGFQTSIYVPSTQERTRFETRDKIGVRFLPLGMVARPGLSIHALSRTPVGRYVTQVANAFGFLRPLRSAMSADRVDLLLVQEYWTARFDVLARWLPTPIVAVDQGLPDRHEIKALKRRSFRYAAGVITQTEQEARKVRRLGGEATRIQNAVDADLFAPGPLPQDDGTTRILAVGRIHDVQKRHSDLVRALARLPPPWQLEIAGRGPDLDTLRSLAQSLGVADRLVLHGFVADKRQLRDLYRRAHIFAMPSAYEGLPMTVLEAMSCGVPVVGSNIAAISEVVDATSGVLVHVGNVEQLVAAFSRCAERRSELGNGARRAVLDHYSRQAVGPRLESFLRARASPGHGGFAT